MNTFHILQLNDICFIHILEYLGIEDQANFAHVCSLFRRIVKNYSKCKYIRIEQPNVRLKLILFCTIADNIEKLYINVDNLRQKDKWCQKMFYRFWNRNEIHKRSEILEHILKTARNSSNLRRLEIASNDIFVTWHIKGLRSLKLLTELALNIKLSPQNVIDFCKFNTNLRILHLNEFPTYVENIKNIASYCKNIEELTFYLKTEARKYFWIAELPNLKKLTIHGFNNWSAMAKFCKGLAETDCQRIQCLEIKINFIDYQATLEIVRIKSLKSLRFDFFNPKCVELLAELIELENITIVMWPTVRKIAPALLRVLQCCKKLNRVHVEGGNLTSEFVYDAIKILQSVRNIKEQKPLILEVARFKHLMPVELTAADKKYLIFRFQP